MNSVFLGLEGGKSSLLDGKISGKDGVRLIIFWFFRCPDLEATGWADFMVGLGLTKSPRFKEREDGLEVSHLGRRD